MKSSHFGPMIPENLKKNFQKLNDKASNCKNVFLLKDQKLHRYDHRLFVSTSGLSPGNASYREPLF